MIHYQLSIWDSSMKRAAFSSSSSLPALRLTRTRSPSNHIPSISHSSPPPATALALRLQRLSFHCQPTIARPAIHQISIRTHNSMSESEVKSKTTEKEAPVEVPEKKKKIPPPPEQPEPGDCCGSGCVRCVWDVYYDELEEYNKLINEISPSSTDPSAS